ncbi:MAG: glycerol-3-phosphate responsive antiterminator [Clostridia bacterium]|nr:glycerol-3-phosphate responsive antiterminator [Clostridia bacterium]
MEEQTCYTEEKQWGRVIAAVRSEEELQAALTSDTKLIFDLNPDIMTLPAKLKKAKAAEKKLFIHLDFAKGIGKDGSGLLLLKRMGVEGIISTKANLIKLARERGMFTVQRFFIVDSQSVQTTVETVRSSLPDVIEVMPGTTDKVIARLYQHLSIPLIAGGLVESEKEVMAALASGAVAVSTGRRELWSLFRSEP